MNHPHMTSIQSGRIKELDALRGIAALFVVLFHFSLDLPKVNPIFQFGVTGVDMFFILSGFVIFMTLNKIKTGRQFIISRTARLYPAYWSCVTLTFILITITKIPNNEGINYFSLREYVANMSMFQYYFKVRDLDGPYWTMIIEMLFYILMLACFQFRLLKYITIIMLILMAFTSYFYLSSFESPFVQSISNAVPLLDFISLFFAGILFYKIYISSEKLILHSVLIVFCLIIQILIFPCSGKSKAFISQGEYGLMLTIYFTLFTLFVFGRLRLIISPVTLFLGKISFALYLIHQYISIRLLLPFLTNTMHIPWFISAFGITLPILIGVATLITYFIEIPARRNILRIADLKKLHGSTGSP